MDIQAICFDLDGTLYDDRQYIRAGLENAADLLAERTGAELHDEIIDLYFEKNIREKTFDHILEQYDLPPELLPDLVEAYHDNDTDLQTYQEVPSVLDYLSNKYQLGLITGGKNGHDKIKRLNLNQYFDQVLITPELGMSKSQPEPFKHTLDTLSVTPTEVVYVGDNPKLDFVHPNRLGMFTVRVKRGIHADDDAKGPSEPDFQVDNLEQVRTAVLRSLNDSF